MQIRNRASEGLKLGDAVAAYCELGNAVASDRATARDLAALCVGRRLARSGNVRLAVALTDLARELEAA
jgi:hypothetical protein